jgi:hypothetical protein
MGCNFLGESETRSYVGVQVKTRIDLNNIKILNILFLIFDILVNF